MTNTSKNVQKQSFLLKLVENLIFWTIFPIIWLVVKIPQTFHRLFVRIPDRGMPIPFNPVGLFRGAFWLWLSTSLQTSSYIVGWPWIGLEDQANAVMDFISKHSLGFIYLPIGAYVAWAVIAGSVGVMFNLASDNEAPSNLGYDSQYSNVNEALRFRDAEMSQNNSVNKMKIFAETGFLTGGSFKGNMTENEKEAARFLDAHLAQQSSVGKLQALKDLFAGR